jgi:hypothetical protein
MRVEQTQLITAEDYFLEVIRPNHRMFFSRKSSFATAVNFAASLYHFHEWLYASHRAGLEASFADTLPSKGDFWRAVEATDKDFGYIREMTDGSKQVRIGGKGIPTPPADMLHIANTRIVSLSFRRAGSGTGPVGGGKTIVTDDSGISINFDHCTTKLYSYWKNLLASLTGKSY